jgi:protocatechuate 3,4-dioxygenase beta subunit
MDNPPDDEVDATDDAAKHLSRRRALTLLTGAGAAVVVAACGSNSKSSAASSSSTAASSASTAAPATSFASSAVATQAIPEETAGPFPGDGSNGPNVLSQNGIVRSDVTKSFGSMSGTAAGVPTAVELTITDLAKGTPFAGAAVYIWHCDRDGLYSLYSNGVTNQNYLRGVQAADANGKVTFTSIFPGAYSGRWPHVHFEVYPTLAEATSTGNTIATSQLALPEQTCNAVYATTGYEQSMRNMASTSLARDMVFSDGADQETPTATGDVNTGIILRLTVPV